MEGEHLVGQGADVLALLVDRIESRADEIPRLREHLATTATQRPRMLCSNHDTIGIVVEHDVVRAPGDEHRMPGAQHDSHARRSDSGHCSTGPSTVFDQSTARIRAPMSPPPANTESIKRVLLRSIAEPRSAGSSRPISPDDADDSPSISHRYEGRRRDLSAALCHSCAAEVPRRARQRNEDT